MKSEPAARDPSRPEPGGRETERITELIHLWSGGDRNALDKLVTALYGELHRLARHIMSAERSDHTLQPTALVHEVFLRLLGDDGLSAENRRHFLAIAARVMRRVLVEHARRRGTQRRGGSFVHVELDENQPEATTRLVDFVALEKALQRLEDVDERRARVVELRFFAGLTLDETADVLGVAQATVVRDWRLARAFLECNLSDPGAAPPA